MENRESKSRIARIFDGLFQRKIELLRAVIEIDDEGLKRTTYLSDGSSNAVSSKWREVSRIAAFKRDLFAYDLLCFEFSDQKGNFVVDEEMEGFDEMIHALPVRLPGAPEVSEWWDKVVQPPFATNVTVLFVREHA